MGRRARAAATAPLAGIVAAMLFAAVLAAPWVERRVTRTVGDVAVDEMRATTGMELVPLGVVAGLVAVLCGVGMLMTRGVARRAAALVTVASGGGVVVAAVVGLLRAFAMDGRITAAPWIAAPAAAAVVAAGVLGRGPGTRRMPPRYDVDVTPDDQEWRIATDPGDARRLDEPAS